jgi:hypothetical protein
LGAVVYTLRAGQPSFVAESPLATLVRVREHVPGPPSRLRAAVDRDLEMICLKRLEKTGTVTAACGDGPRFSYLGFHRMRLTL